MHPGELNSIKQRVQNRGRPGSQAGADAARGFLDALLVLHERDAHVAFAQIAEILFWVFLGLFLLSLIFGRRIFG